MDSVNPSDSSSKPLDGAVKPCPAYFYDGGKIPVFTPDYDTFKDFYQYIQSIESYGNEAGLVKIIPPVEWTLQNFTCVEKVKAFTINHPIVQQFNCGGLPVGSHRQLNIESSKKYSSKRIIKVVEEWADLCETRFRPPVLTDSGKMVLPKCFKNTHAINGNSKLDSSSTGNAAVPENINSKDDIQDCKIEKPSYMLDYNSSGSKDYLNALERFYWRNLSFQSTMYGADLCGSFFTENEENQWNISSLNNILSQVKKDISGVTTPYLYFGMYKSTFAWHVEDMDLFSINYIHFGAPKQWYVIPPSQRNRFENFAAGLFYDESKNCPEFLSSKNITVHKLIQNSNEFVITFPNAYHQGYNTGFNCAESINFATPSWVSIGRKANFCECVSDSVQMDVVGIFGLEDIADTGKNSGTKKRLPRVLAAPQSLNHSNTLLKKLPNPKCLLCPLGHSKEFPLVESDRYNRFAHIECGAFIPETTIEIIPQQDEEKKDLSQPDDENKSPEHITKKAKIHNDSAPIETIDESIQLRSFRVNGINEVPKDRWNLKCSVCQWAGSKQKRLGACVQCTVGKCVKAFHVTCGLLAGIFMDLNDDGALTCYCFAHDPVLRKEKQELKKMNQVENNQGSFSVGTMVIVRYGGCNYEGVILENMLDKRGCNVQFEEQEEPIFVGWDRLRIKLPEKSKVTLKSTPTYSDTKEKKKSAMKLLLETFSVADAENNNVKVGWSKSGEMENYVASREI